MILSFQFPAMATSREEDKTIYVSQNIKTIGEFLKKQDYYEQITKLCHEDLCYSVDVHDLPRSLEVMEEKVLAYILKNYGSEVETKVSLKGFAVTKILTN